MIRRPIEPNLNDALADPVVRAMMAADKVDPAALRTLLAAMALRINATPAPLQRCA